MESVDAVALTIEDVRGIRHSALRRFQLWRAPGTHGISRVDSCPADVVRFLLLAAFILVLDAPRVVQVPCGITCTV